MTFVDAAAAPSRKTGQIKLHSPADFAGMRKAGALTAAALDLLVEHVRPGVTTEALDELVFDFAMAHKPIRHRSAIAAIANRSAPRSTMSSATAFRIAGRSRKATR